MFSDLKKDNWKLRDFYHLWPSGQDYETSAPEDWQRIQDVLRKFNN